MWKKVKLGDVCYLQNGFAFKSKLFRESGKPILRISNIQNQKIDHRKIVYFDPDDYDTDLSRYVVKPNDLLIAMSGATTGKIGFNNSKNTFYLNQRVGNLKPKSMLKKSFLYYLLSTKVKENLRISKGAAQPNLSSEQIKNISFHLPSVEEQEQIVRKLDKTFSQIDFLIKSTRKKISEISALYENIISNEFISIKSCIKKRLFEVCEKITDGTHQTPKYFNEGYIFLSSKNVTTRKIDWKDVRYVDKKQHDELQKRVSPKIGDILLAKNGTTGVAAIVDKDLVFDIYVSLAWLRSKGEVLPEYLHEYLNSRMARDQFKIRTRGIGVPNLHLREIREVEIIFPSDLKEQKIIVEKLKKIDDLCTLYKFVNDEKIKSLISLKSSILSEELNSKTQ